jgi:hypothetical protein
MLAAFTFLLHMSLFIRVLSLTREQYRLHSFSRWRLYASARLLKIMCQWSLVHTKGPPTALLILSFYTNITTDIQIPYTPILDSKTCISATSTTKLYLLVQPKHSPRWFRTRAFTSILRLSATLRGATEGTLFLSTLLSSPATQTMSGSRQWKANVSLSWWTC